MRKTEAGQSPALDRYLVRLEAELRNVPPADRREILLETRSHVLERTSRAPSRSVKEVLAELGPAEEYARQFLPDSEPQQTDRPGVLRGIAYLATGRWTTLPLFFVVIGAYAVAALAFAIGVWKLVEPNATGLWITDLGGGRRSVGLVVSDPNQKGREVLGYWLVPLALGISVTIHLAMSALLRRVLRTDARGR
ncbi:MAG: hypothetical protein ABR499_17240 [Gemmatimonadaceae bacterium]